MNVCTLTVVAADAAGCRKTHAALGLLKMNKTSLKSTIAYRSEYIPPASILSNYSQHQKHFLNPQIYLEENGDNRVDLNRRIIYW